MEQQAMLKLKKRSPSLVMICYGIPPKVKRRIYRVRSMLYCSFIKRTIVETRWGAWAHNPSNGEMETYLSLWLTSQAYPSSEPGVSMKSLIFKETNEHNTSKREREKVIETIFNIILLNTEYKDTSWTRICLHRL